MTKIVYYGPGLSGRSTNILYLASLLPDARLSTECDPILKFSEYTGTWFQQREAPDAVIQAIHALQARPFHSETELLTALQQQLSQEMLHAYATELVQNAKTTGTMHRLRMTAQDFSALPFTTPIAPEFPLDLCMFSSNIVGDPGRQHLLVGAHGVIFVVDSQEARLHANLAALEEFSNALRRHGGTLHQFPWVIQYNKRDLEHILPVQALDASVNLLNVPTIEAVASHGSGVLETLVAVFRVIERQANGER